MKILDPLQKSAHFTRLTNTQKTSEKQATQLSIVHHTIFHMRTSTINLIHLYKLEIHSDRRRRRRRPHGLKCYEKTLKEISSLERRTRIVYGALYSWFFLLKAKSDDRLIRCRTLEQTHDVTDAFENINFGHKFLFMRLSLNSLNVEPTTFILSYLWHSSQFTMFVWHRLVPADELW